MIIKSYNLSNHIDKQTSANKTASPVCQFCANLAPKRMAIDRLSINGQNGAKPCLT